MQSHKHAVLTTPWKQRRATKRPDAKPDQPDALFAPVRQYLDAQTATYNLMRIWTPVGSGVGHARKDGARFCWVRGVPRTARQHYAAIG